MLIQIGDVTAPTTDFFFFFLLKCKEHRCVFSNGKWIHRKGYLTTGLEKMVGWVIFGNDDGQRKEPAFFFNGVFIHMI